MDPLHIPPWDSSSGSFEEYPNASIFKAAASSKRVAKSEKSQRCEQGRLQKLINRVVRLSGPSPDTAGMSSIAQHHHLRFNAQFVLLKAGLADHPAPKSDVVP